jgi:hypothetical protein
MEVEWFKHRQLAPTVGPSTWLLGEFEGTLSKSINSATTSVAPFVGQTIYGRARVKFEAIEDVSSRQQVSPWQSVQFEVDSYSVALYNSVADRFPSSRRVWLQTAE